MASYTAEAPPSERQPLNRPRVVPALPLSVVRNQKSKKKQTPPQQNAPTIEAQAQEPNAQNDPMSSTANGLNTPESASSRASNEPSGIQSPVAQTPTSLPSAVTTEDNATDHSTSEVRAQSGATAKESTAPGEPATGLHNENQDESRADMGAHQSGHDFHKSSLRIPTELPPPFVPAPQGPPVSFAPLFGYEQVGGRYTPVSMPQPLLSANRPVFGGYAESSSPSPTTAGHFGPPPATAVDANIDMIYAPVSAPNFQSAPPGRFAVQPHLRRPTTFFNPEANFYPQSAVPQFGPRIHPYAVPNGEHLSRSVSQASSQAQDIRERPQSHDSDATDGRFTAGVFHLRGGGGPVGQAQNGFVISSPPVLPQAYSINPSIEAALALRDFLLSEFGNSETADFILEITDGKSVEPMFTIPLHCLLISRSPPLAIMMADGFLRYDYSKDKFFQYEAFAEALKYLYGAPLLDISLLGKLPPVSMSGEYGDITALAQRLMAHALGYTSAGRFLQLPPVELQGLKSAVEVLRWENVETALAFAIQDAAEPPFEPFLLEVLSFMVLHLPDHFSFVGTPQTVESQRHSVNPSFRIASETRRPSIPDPRVSRLIFGELSFGEAPAVDPISSKFSSILTTLPFAVLKLVLEDPRLVTQLSASKVAELANAVIEEREKRKRKAAKAKQVTSVDNEHLADEVEWEESVESVDNGHGTAFNITRVRKSVEQTGEGEKGVGGAQSSS